MNASKHKKLKSLKSSKKLKQRKRVEENRVDQFEGLRWFKSRASGSGGCVEVAHLPEGGVAVRDTKDRGKAPHLYTRHEWDAFLIGVKNGEFDLPA